MPKNFISKILFFGSFLNSERSSITFWFWSNVSETQGRGSNDNQLHFFPPTGTKSRKKGFQKKLKVRLDSLVHYQQWINVQTWENEMKRCSCFFFIFFSWVRKKESEEIKRKRSSLFAWTVKIFIVRKFQSFILKSLEHRRKKRLFFIREKLNVITWDRSLLKIRRKIEKVQKMILWVCTFTSRMSCWKAFGEKLINHQLVKKTMFANKVLIKIGRVIMLLANTQLMFMSPGQAYKYK